MKDIDKLGKVILIVILIIIAVYVAIYTLIRTGVIVPNVKIYDTQQTTVEDSNMTTFE